jgi:hypothetical protein
MRWTHFAFDRTYAWKDGQQQHSRKKRTREQDAGCLAVVKFVFMEMQ